MLDSEIVRQWSLDVRKMARPERSGVLANLIVYALLWGWGYALVPHDWSGDGFSLKCYLAPWECRKEERVTVREIEEHYHIDYLASGKRRKKECTCRYEFRHGDEVFAWRAASRERLREPCGHLLWTSDWLLIRGVYPDWTQIQFPDMRIYPTDEVYYRIVCGFGPSPTVRPFGF